MGIFSGSNYWALILGGSSGMGYASAEKLASEGMNICIVHRDRKSEQPDIEAKFEKLRQWPVQVLTFNKNALLAENRTDILDAIGSELAENGKIRLLLHCISRGNLKRFADIQSTPPFSLQETSDVGILPPQLMEAWEKLAQFTIESQKNVAILKEDDFRSSIYAMATSLWDWVQELITRDLFAEDARILGLTSEGAYKVFPAYGAVAMAKSVLESLIKSMAVELAALGIRSNLIQAGITNTPSLRMIPASEQLKISALYRNPFRRLTLPEDIANVVFLLTLDESAWINGAVIPVDGGESLQ